jgi:hypothetical protein
MTIVSTSNIKAAVITTNQLARTNRSADWEFLA